MIKRKKFLGGEAVFFFSAQFVGKTIRRRLTSLSGLVDTRSILPAEVLWHIEGVNRKDVFNE